MRGKLDSLTPDDQQKKDDPTEVGKKGETVLLFLATFVASLYNNDRAEAGKKFIATFLSAIGFAKGEGRREWRSSRRQVKVYVQIFSRWSVLFHYRTNDWASAFF
ncbi:MAG: hypothetical protein V1668_00110 [Patescibacteria group bacterium]